MKTFTGISKISAAIPSCVVTIGNFDGLHLGHQALIAALVKLSGKYNCPAVVFTFDPHPLEVLAPEVGHKRIFTKRDLQEQLHQRGIDYLIIEPFSKQFSKTTASDFLQNYLKQTLNPKALVVGHDFAFGEKRSGTLELLQNYCDHEAIELVIVEPVKSEKTVSSSLIRQCIRLGKMQQVRDMLGRAYYVSGAVVKGDGRGRTIGVPTINLNLSSDIQPAPGVYVTSVLIEGEWLPSVSNIGCKPTFHRDEKAQKTFTIETHILDFSKDLYGEDLQVQFFKRLRDEKRFSGADELVSQIHLDIDNARKYFEVQQ